MQLVIVSACLLGQRVRYDAGHRGICSSILDRWEKEGRVIPLCPEVSAGLPIPRPAAEVVGGDGREVLAGRARVIEISGRDVTGLYVRGAEIALGVARARGVKVAVLKELSPSCGSSAIYDGRFSGRTIDASGVAAALLRSAGVQVFSEYQMDAAEAFLNGVERAE